MRPEKLIHEKTYVKKSPNRVPIERVARTNLEKYR